MAVRIRPKADYEVDFGADGRGSKRTYVRYFCPTCNKRIKECDMGCADCGIFFDWSKKAKVVTRTELIWE